MINELFPFQMRAVRDLHRLSSMAVDYYQKVKIPQVISLQAPTGSGKTIIVSALMENIYFGTDELPEQPDAIFVWLSDSPTLNEQSKNKIDQKADRIRFDQCVMISEESFDQELLEDGRIYFLNTQKLGKGGKLGQHSDTRQYTIWETIENTARQKANRLYFIIDEAHRGMHGTEAGKATSIMQRFLKGSPAHHLSPVPVVIGMSATAERFNKLVGNTTNTLHKVTVSPADVRSSGLLKDRIILTYPDDPSKQSDMAVLQAATEEWINKCDHWQLYSASQHDTNVNPVFVVQVAAGSGKKVSDTDLEDVVAKIEERAGFRFKDNEVVHTFGSAGTLVLNGLTVHHIEPDAITEDRRVRVVLFKENLSTGWDCPRAETMMSFRHAEDATYIAQLLGRMIRTPLQRHIMVDDSLNDVRLYLPYFNRDTVLDIIKELQSAEGGEIPTVIDEESMENSTYETWTVHQRKPPARKEVPGQLMSDLPIKGDETDAISAQQGTGASAQTWQTNPADSPAGETQSQPGTVQPFSWGNGQPEYTGKPETDYVEPETEQQQMDQILLDREKVLKFINEQGYLTYMVRNIRMNSYLKSMLSLAGLLTQNDIYANANDEIKNDVVEMIHQYVDDLHQRGKYSELAKKVLEFKLSTQVFDVFGEAMKDFFATNEMVAMADTDIDRQLRAADARLGSYGFPNYYGQKYCDFSDPNAFKIDCILFAADDECIKKLNKYAEDKFHALNDKYRKYVVNKSERCKKQYSDIIRDGDQVSEHNFSVPEIYNKKPEPDGQEYADHLLADENGKAIIRLNSWEDGVLQEERRQSDYVCWLRNPDRQVWSLCIPYEIDNDTKPMYPDFLIIRHDDQLGFVVDILEPHNDGFKDNLGKAKGLARYAEKEQRMGRIQLIRMGKDAAGNKRFIRLDLAKGAVRQAVLKAINNDELDHLFDVYKETLE